MPADVTPTPFSTSKQLILVDDQVENRYAQVTPVNSSSLVASVNQTGEAMFGRAFIYTQSYSIGGQSTSTFVVSTNLTSYAYTVSKVTSSAPIVLVDMTVYLGVVATNTTVWSSQNTASSLLLSAAGAGNDVQHYKVAVVADTVV